MPPIPDRSRRLQISTAAGLTVAVFVGLFLHLFAHPAQNLPNDRPLSGIIQIALACGLLTMSLTYFLLRNSGR